MHVLCQEPRDPGSEGLQARRGFSPKKHEAEIWVPRRTCACGNAADNKKPQPPTLLAWPQQCLHPVLPPLLFSAGPQLGHQVGNKGKTRAEPDSRMLLSAMLTRRVVCGSPIVSNTNMWLKQLTASPSSRRHSELCGVCCVMAPGASPSFPMGWLSSWHTTWANLQLMCVCLKADVAAPSGGPAP